MNRDYAAILHHSRPRSERHRPVSNAERAIQFAPFAALTGLDAALDDAERLALRLAEEADERALPLPESETAP